MGHKIIPFFLPVIILLTSCQSDYQKAESTINGEDMKRIVKTFSSDEFMGRKPFTRGEEKAVNFLINEYRRIGLEPAIGESYLQEVPMVEVTNTPEDKMKINFRHTWLELSYKNDFVAFSRQLVDEININHSELVFAGYGIVAPEYQWNDYEGLDVKNKTILAMGQIITAFLMAMP